ncbi:hypothetical protein LTR49_022836 [Elasticomyces elasticus]|nr:hypothetical protein LTR49_022836 [Elasticomyces elasticus]KAK5748188.1 hypothetical protein LTS12_021754 [Elasticomyces elasticus]
MAHSCEAYACPHGEARDLRVVSYPPSKAPPLIEPLPLPPAHPLKFGVCPETVKIFSASRGTADLRTPNISASKLPYIIRDLIKDDRFRDKSYVSGWPHFRSYAEVPLTSPNGYVIGSYYVIDDKPHEFKDSEVSILSDIACTVMDYLNLDKTKLEKDRADCLVLGIGSYVDGAKDLRQRLTEDEAASLVPPTQHEQMDAAVGFIDGQNLGVPSVSHTALSASTESTTPHRQASGSQMPLSSDDTMDESLCRDSATGFDLPTRIETNTPSPVRQQLAREFNVETEKQAKPIVRAEDEYALLQTLRSSPSFTLDHERLRVQLAFIAQLAGITGNRPGALLALRYGDLKITLFRDPHQVDTPNITLDFTFRQTKSYRGPKDPNTFAVPEICNDSCLPCCPQVVLLGLLFADNAFASERLTGPDKLSSLRVPKNLHQLSIPIKESLAAVPIFRAVTQNASGYMISPTAQATANWLRQQFKRWGEATGFELPLKPYGFRRDHGEALDSNAHISDAQRNLVMGHATSGVFERNYLSRYVTQDTQSVYRGLDPQTAVIRLASGMMRSIDVRQPTTLSAKQRDEVDQELELRLLQRTCRSLAAQIRAAHGSIKKANGTKLV